MLLEQLYVGAVVHVTGLFQVQMVLGAGCFWSSWQVVKGAGYHPFGNSEVFLFNINYLSNDFADSHHFVLALQSLERVV